MSTAKHNPVLNYVRDQDIIKLGGDPVRLCVHFGIPVSRVEGVVYSKTEKVANFNYNGNSFKRVELVAKKFYEDKGLEASWSEGAALVLVRVAINGAIARRISGLFKLMSLDEYLAQFDNEDLISVHRERLTTEHEKRERSFEERSTETYKLIRTHLRAIMLGDVSRQKSALDDDESDSPIGDSKKVFFTKPVQINQSPEVIKELVNSAYSSICEKPPLDELVEHMKNFIKHQQERYSDPKSRYMMTNYSEWTVSFARRLVEVLGLRDFNFELIPGQESPFLCMERFDLNVLDVKNKSLRIVEVKNTDSFTPFQLVGIQGWIDLPPSIRPPFEVCVVQPT